MIKYELNRRGTDDDGQAAAEQLAAEHVVGAGSAATERPLEERPLEERMALPTATRLAAEWSASWPEVSAYSRRDRSNQHTMMAPGLEEIIKLVVSVQRWSHAGGPNASEVKYEPKQGSWWTQVHVSHPDGYSGIIDLKRGSVGTPALKWLRTPAGGDSY